MFSRNFWISLIVACFIGGLLWFIFFTMTYKLIRPSEPTPKSQALNIIERSNHFQLKALAIQTQLDDCEKTR